MKVEIDDVIVDSVVSLVTNDQRGFDLAVELHVKLPTITDADAARDLVTKAHSVCPYSNAITRQRRRRVHRQRRIARVVRVLP